MSYKSKAQLISHDAAGFESDFIDFSEYDDEYGNRVAHGDLSVQRAVEEGCRNTIASEHHGDIMATGFDKHPFMSKVQWRKMASLEARGEVPAGTMHKWAGHSKSYKSLPEKKG